MNFLFQVSNCKKQITMAAVFLAAFLTLFTTVFQFSLHTDRLPMANHQTVKEELKDQSSDLSADDSSHEDDDQRPSVSTLQAVSPGVPIHLSYDPIVWVEEQVSILISKVESPRKLYQASWEYFRILFRDIISPNAP